MELTTAMLNRFTGGQLQISNSNAGYIYRGQIKRAVVAEERLRVSFDWLACGEDYPPTRWSNVPDCVDYVASLEIYTIDHGATTDECLVVESGFDDEVLLFFPPNSKSQLLPQQVEGLMLPAA